MSITSFLHVPPDSHFAIRNLPYGVFSRKGGQRRIGVALGENVIDLAALSQHGLFSGPYLLNTSCFEQVKTLVPSMVFGCCSPNRIAGLVSEHTEQLHEPWQKRMDRGSRNYH